MKKLICKWFNLVPKEQYLQLEKQKIQVENDIYRLLKGGPIQKSFTTLKYETIYAVDDMIFSGEDSAELSGFKEFEL